MSKLSCQKNLKLFVVNVEAIELLISYLDFKLKVLLLEFIAHVGFR